MVRNLRTRAQFTVLDSGRIQSVAGQWYNKYVSPPLHSQVTSGNSYQRLSKDCIQSAKCSSNLSKTSDLFTY